MAAAYLFSESASSQRGEAESTSRAEPRYSWHAALDVVPHVSVTVRKDHETGHWSYSYTLTNDSTSAHVITEFALDPVEEVISIAGIEHWYHSHGSENRRQAAVWSVVDVGPTPTDWDSVSLYPSIFDVQPGEVVDGFNIISRRSPGLINYYVQGFHDLPSWGEPYEPTLFDNAVTGLILGPGGLPADSSSQQWFNSSRSLPLSADSLRGPKQAVALVISAGVSKNNSSEDYTYSYSIIKERSSKNALAVFAVSPVPKPVTIISPEGWSSFHGWQDDSTAVVWTVTKFGPEPPDWSGNYYIGPFHTQPGDTVTSFQIIVSYPPARHMNFFAQGFDTIPRGRSHEERYVKKRLWEDSVTGITLGPDIENSVREEE